MLAPYLHGTYTSCGHLCFAVILLFTVTQHLKPFLIIFTLNAVYYLILLILLILRVLPIVQQFSRNYFCYYFYYFYLSIYHPSICACVCLSAKLSSYRTADHHFFAGDGRFLLKSSIVTLDLTLFF